MLLEILTKNDMKISKNIILVGVLIGYLIAKNNYSNQNYSNQIKGLEEGLKLSCQGLNEVNSKLNALSYLTGVDAKLMDWWNSKKLGK